MKRTEPKSPPIILAVDVGTSSLKAALYNVRGELLEMVTRRYGYDAPRPGWAEADPDDWWRALVAALADLREQGFDLHPVQAIGLTGQMHTPVLLGENGRPTSPAILWLDNRATEETEILQEQLGLPPHQLNSSYTLPKLLWLHRHRPRVLEETRTLLWPKDYVRYRLTGRALTDVTEAAGAALLDWEWRAWAVERLALVGLNVSVLPPLRPITADAGPLLADIAAQLGLSTQAKVIVGAGDVLALLGGAPPKIGRMTCSLGSSSMLSSPLAADQQIDDPGQRLHVYPLASFRLLNGIQSTSGASLTWAWKALYGDETPLDVVVNAALETPPGAEGLFFLPFLAGERSPYWSDDLRGGFYGLTTAHGRPHMIRAVLEGVAYSLRHLLEIAAELGAPMDEIALAGGGAGVPGWPQIIADACQLPVSVFCTHQTVTRPLYAYCASALDPGLSFEEALSRTFTETPRRYRPDPALAELYDPIYQRYQMLATFVAGAMNLSKT